MHYDAGPAKPAFPACLYIRCAFLSYTGRVAYVANSKNRTPADPTPADLPLRLQRTMRAYIIRTFSALLLLTPAASAGYTPSLHTGLSSAKAAEHGRTDLKPWAARSVGGTQHRNAILVRGGAIKTAPETYAAYVDLGVRQGTMPTAPMVGHSILAGGFIALGAVLAMSVGANLPGISSANAGLQKMMLGAFGLPVGLLMVVLTGAQLFTSNTAAVTAAACEGTVTKQQAIKNWVVSYFGNFIGAVAVAYLVHAAGLFPTGASVAKVAVAKCSIPFGQAFLRGVLCNWMVCLAVWQATAAGDLAGKALGIWLPISAFVAIGFEHSIANMAFVPLGMLSGADVTIESFVLNNLVPVTLGNLLSGSLMVGWTYSKLYGRR